jgi:hypothetical protein
MEEVLVHQAEWMREEEEQERRAGRYTTTEAHHQQQEKNDNNGTQSPLSPLEQDTPNMMNDHDTHIALIEHRNKSRGIVINARPKCNNVKLLAHELVALDYSKGNWAEEMDKEIQLVKEGEYRLASYSPAPSPTPWNPPHPPTSKYTPPRTHYTLP